MRASAASSGVLNAFCWIGRGRRVGGEQRPPARRKRTSEAQAEPEARHRSRSPKSVRSAVLELITSPPSATAPSAAAPHATPMDPMLEAPRELLARALCRCSRGSRR